MYQFPMGKVKIVEIFNNLPISVMYQFPMGKVKLSSVTLIEIEDISYQFPMGKVKGKLKKKIGKVF